MKIKQLLIVSMLLSAGLALVGLAGCSKGGGSIDTSRVKTAFENAPPVDKTEVQNLITAVQQKDYSTALASCKKVVTSANLTEDQKSALQDLMEQIKTKGLGVGQAVGGGGDLTNSVQGAGKAIQDSTKPAQP